MAVGLFPLLQLSDKTAAEATLLEHQAQMREVVEKKVRAAAVVPFRPVPSGHDVQTHSVVLRPASFLLYPWLS